MSAIEKMAEALRLQQQANSLLLEALEEVLKTSSKKTLPPAAAPKVAAALPPATPAVKRGRPSHLDRLNKAVEEHDTSGDHTPLVSAWQALPAANRSKIWSDWAAGFEATAPNKAQWLQSVQAWLETNHA